MILRRLAFAVRHPRQYRLIQQGHILLMAPHRPTSSFWCPACKREECVP